MSTWKTIGQLIEMKGTIPAEPIEPAPATAPKTYATLEQAARALAKAQGWKGTRSGWIFDPATDKTLAQGYLGLGIKMQKRGRIAGSLATGYTLTEGAGR